MPGAVARIASYTSYIAVYFLPGCQARLMPSVQTKLTNRPISLRLVPSQNADAIAVLVLARRDQAGPTEKRDQISSRHGGGTSATRLSKHVGEMIGDLKIVRHLVVRQ